MRNDTFVVKVSFFIYKGVLIMKAIVLNKAGKPEQLKYEERTIPKLTPEHSIIKIKAFGLNHAESITRKGGSPSVKLPRVIGIELVGIIYQTADPKFHVGQAIYTFQGGLGRQFDGSYQEYASVPNKNIFTFPGEMNESWAELATIPQSGYTAFGSIKVTKVQAGDHVLLRGGTTTVGIAATRLLKAMNVKVAASTRSEKHADIIKKQGADKVIIDKNGVLQTDETFDAIIDFVGVTTMVDTLSHIKLNGYVVETGELDDEWGNKFNIFSIPTGSYLTSFQSSYIRKDWLKEMMQLIQNDNIKFPISKIFDFNQIVEAHKLLDSGKSLGKIVVKVN